VKKILTLSVLLISFSWLFLSAYIDPLRPDVKNPEIIISPNGKTLMTEVIQKAIDSCADLGGGTIIFYEGVYYSGSLTLRSKISLQLNKGAIIKGSDKYSDYLNDAFFFGSEISDVSITGEGIIDGVDCYNPHGEEGFRGPHCIRFVKCRNIRLEGITIINSANWAVNCRHCSEAYVTNVKIRGGHDGLHTRFCNNFTVKGCDFRTGDDAFAGNDNLDFAISFCNINTSCNGFRLGCQNLAIKHCRLWGPGEYMHKKQKRNNMLCAFVHFSPKDDNPVLTSGNWTIDDVTIDNVDNVYMYNFRNGLWQTGQPVTKVSFNNVTAKGILRAFYINGDSGSLFSMKIHNSEFAFREGAEKKSDKFEGADLDSPESFYAARFNFISLEEVTFDSKDSSVLLHCESGNKINLEKVKFITGSGTLPLRFDSIKGIEMNRLFLNGIKIQGKERSRTKRS
jgi:hypothetical protein